MVDWLLVETLSSNEAELRECAVVYAVMVDWCIGRVVVGDGGACGPTLGSFPPVEIIPECLHQQWLVSGHTQEWLPGRPVVPDLLRPGLSNAEAEAVEAEVSALARL